MLTAPGVDREELARQGLADSATVHALTDTVPAPHDLAAVVLAVPDLVGLRRAVTGLANVGRARTVAVWFQRAVPQLPVVVPGPRWPGLERVVAGRSPSPYVVLELVAEAQARPVLLEIARVAAPSARFGVAWPALGLVRGDPALWPPADPSAKVAVPGRVLDQGVDAPPDLVLARAEVLAGQELPEADHPVLGRPTRVETREPDLTWESWQAMPPGEGTRALAARGTTSLGAVDEHLVNPIGFERDAAATVATLGAGPGDRLVVAGDTGGSTEIRPVVGLSEVDLPALRRLAGVRLAWSGGPGPQAYCRAVAGLACAGVPVRADHVPDWARLLLDPGLAAALGEPVDLTDRLRREEHSVRVRRAALGSHATGPWRRRLAAAHDLQVPPDLTVSVLLVTRRPAMLRFALRQVARQRGVALELVLATHGFTPDAAELERFRAACDVPLTTLEAEPAAVFGEVLDRAAARAGGDALLKMDDDDWYGPDFAADLVLARGYSGADVTGCPPELTYLEPIDVTLRDTTTTEVYRPFVAGGTLLVDRGAFRSLGGFRHTRKYVDAGPARRGDERRRPGLPHPRPRLRPATRGDRPHLGPGARALPRPAARARPVARVPAQRAARAR